MWKATRTAIGSDRLNQKLGLDRANTVRDFLVKYGARANQIDTVSRGKAAPKVANPNDGLQPDRRSPFHEPPRGADGHG